MRRTLAGIVAASGLFGVATIQAQEPKAPVEWKPASVLLATLAPPVPVGIYQVRPPQGYELQTRPGPTGSLSYSFVGPVRPDGTRGFLMVATITPPLEERKPYSLEYYLTRLTENLKSRRSPLKRGPVETGKIGAFSFVRQQWTGTDTQTGFPMSGFNYIGRDGDTILWLWSQDIQAEVDKSLALTGASALTFTRKPAAPPAPPN